MKKIFLIFIAMIAFFNIASAQEESSAEPIPAKISVDIILKDPKLIKINEYNNASEVEFNEKIAQDNEEYKIYEKRLNDDYYLLYRVFEKIVRANNLYNQSWRLAIKSATTDVNASATAANLVIVNSSLFDSLYDDPDALAFVLSHEISHILLKHNQATYENRTEINKNKKTASQMRSEAHRQNYYATMNRYYGHDYASIGNSIMVLTSLIGERVAKSKVNKLYEKERQLEWEADNNALVLVAKAGFNVNSAKDALVFISNIPHKYTKSSTHPDINERIASASSKAQSLNINELKAQGKNNIFNSKVLPVRKSSDKKTIVISKLTDETNQMYKPQTSENNLLEKAYKNYINKDMTTAKKYFEDAYLMNKENYIPALYLSYINEYEYLKNKDTEALKSAQDWAKKANAINENENTLKQIEEIEKY